MTVITSLLIASPGFQEALVAKDGTPLANGVITFYEDTNRTVLKNVYYETGSPGSYTFVALPNPLVLSAAGTVVDPSGNDTLIFFYPYDETSISSSPPVQKYYVTVVDQFGVTQFDRQDFPYDLSTNSGGGGGVITSPTFENVVVNNEFWRNIGPTGSVNPFITTVGTISNGITLAPSQHDGFSFPDIEYVVIGSGDTETISFQTFAAGGQTLVGDVTPEYYLDFKCTNSTGGETSKIIQIPLSLHLKTLGGLPNCVVTLQGLSVSGDPLIHVAILPYYGTGGSSPAPAVVDTITLTNSWTKYISPTFTMPNSSASISTTGDDAFYLQIQLPTDAAEIQLAKISLYLSADIPTNDFATYDQIDTIISDPRTGDVRTSLNAFQPFGWVLCNDGLISNGGVIAPATPVIARQNVDTWPLFNLLWPLNAIPIYNSGGPTTRLASAYADWFAGKLLGLPLMLGRALLGLPPAAGVTSYVAATGIFTVTPPFGSLVYVGTPIMLSVVASGVLPNEFNATTIYYGIPLGASTFQLATSYANALAGTPITGADNGTPPFNVNVQLGSGLGQARHVQLEAELATHSHPGTSVPDAASAGGAAGVVVQGTTQTSTLVLNIAPDGSSAPFNIVQPSTYLNVFFKL